MTMFGAFELLERVTRSSRSVQSLRCDLPRQEPGDTREFQHSATRTPIASTAMGLLKGKV